MPFSKPIFIGNSEQIKKIKELVRKLADTDLNVLVCGESGVGKELVARSLHYYSHRKLKPFIKVNCTALPVTLIESELFGYERGAFTGADRQKSGKFEIAGDGSIFLDEIGEIPKFVQAKLLQVLQDRKFPRVGGYKDVKVNARVITATNRDLKSDIISGSFREDLYYRINIINITIPPLREHKEDLELLIDYFLKQQHDKYKLPNFKISPHLIDLFNQYHWPGNIRQLENYIKRLAVLGNIDDFEGEFLARINRQQQANKPNLQIETEKSFSDTHTKESDIKNISSLKEIRDKVVYKVEKEIIKKVLDENNWNRKKTAKILKICYRTLLYKVKEMGIKPH
ncbi:MAG: sigma-54-dependent Fis family transcriptional regulator [Deltaproteobacteria bacterium]|nr:sigma-54-dependent Fis family transcriptional regulator [Deltaproteobacteria bacterium]MBW2661217.1 sigma-54-dependent Fis family transcriptional regulator [Deltaproteobacteria bacterium]